MGSSTTVGAILSCSHRDEVRKAIHGHSYEVWATFAGEPARDATVLQATLRGVLAAWDHKTLPDDLSRAEDLARAIGTLLDGCISVKVRRPLEMFEAAWQA